MLEDFNLTTGDSFHACDSTQFLNYSTPFSVKDILSMNMGQESDFEYGNVMVKKENENTLWVDDGWFNGAQFPHNYNGFMSSNTEWSSKTVDFFGRQHEFGISKMNEGARSSSPSKFKSYISCTNIIIDNSRELKNYSSCCSKNID